MIWIVGGVIAEVVAVSNLLVQLKTKWRAMANFRVVLEQNGVNLGFGHPHAQGRPARPREPRQPGHDQAEQHASEKELATHGRYQPMACLILVSKGIGRRRSSRPTTLSLT